MMEFWFCLLNHMKFYPTPYICNVWNMYARRNKENFLFKLDNRYKWKGIEIDNILIFYIMELCYRISKERRFHFYHYYDITYSNPTGYQKKMDSRFDRFAEIKKRQNNQKYWFFFFANSIVQKMNDSQKREIFLLFFSKIRKIYM